MNGSLKALLELAATANNKSDEEISIESLFPSVIADYMRFEMLAKKAVDQTINEHLAGLNLQEIIKAKSIYTKEYFLALPIPYFGIQKLCRELVSACHKFKTSPTQDWSDFADGVFEWEKDISDMEVVQS